MKRKAKIHKYDRNIIRCIQRESFFSGDTHLIVEDRIPVFSPWRGERILRIAGTTAFYSAVPLGPARHRLLCYDYCARALQKQGKKPGFYRNALVLGCGGGAMPGWLLDTYPSLVVDVVDISPEIIAVCKKYFLSRWNRSERLRYYCEDAREYEPPDYQYQFIFCDLFDGQNLAPLVYDKEFALKLRDMLCEDGLLVINCGLDELFDVLPVYRKVFPHLQIVERKPWQTQVIKVGFSAFPADRS